jgi:hypothetical protein
LTDEAEKARDYLMNYQEEWQNIWKISDSTRVTYFQMGRASFDTIDFWILNKNINVGFWSWITLKFNF